MRTHLIALLVGALLTDRASAGDPSIMLGSEKFTESYVLSELGKRSLEEAGRRASPGHGRNNCIVEALKQGSIAAYPDYTGTIQEEILKSPGVPSVGTLREELAQYGVGITEELGFNNTYALVMTRVRAKQLAFKK